MMAAREVASQLLPIHDKATFRDQDCATPKVAIIDGDSYACREGIRVDERQLSHVLGTLRLAGQLPMICTGGQS
jgi:hypothetical protein